MKRANRVPDRPAWWPLATATAILIPAIVLLAWWRLDPVVVTLCAIAALSYFVAVATVVRGARYWRANSHYGAATSAFVSAVHRLRPAPEIHEDVASGIIVVRAKPNRTWPLLSGDEVLWKFDSTDLREAAQRGDEAKPVVATRYGFSRYSPVWTATEAYEFADVVPARRATRRSLGAFGRRTGVLYAGSEELELVVKVIRNSKPAAEGPESV